MRIITDEVLFNLNNFSIDSYTKISDIEEIKKICTNKDAYFYLNLNLDIPAILLDKGYYNFNNKNHLFNLMSNSVVWYDCSSIVRSLFFYNSTKHLNKRAPIYVVVPFYCYPSFTVAPRLLFDDSFSYLCDKEIDITTFNGLFDNFYHAIFGKNLIYKDLNEFGDLTDELNDIEYYKNKINKLDSFLIKEVFYKFLYDKETGFNFVDYLINEITNPEKNKFKVVKYKDISKIGKNKKVWSESKFLLIRSDIFNDYIL